MFIIPVLESEEELRIIEDRVKSYISPGTEIDVRAIRFGTESNETFLDEVMNAPSVAKLAREAQYEGCDGIFIECMLDIGLEAAREVVRIPVVGPGRLSLLAAVDLEENFSIITELENTNTPFLKLVSSLGLEQKLTSIRSIDIPMLELKDRSRLEEAVLETSLSAIRDDGAHGLVLGCTRMFGIEESVQGRLRDAGYRVPVIYGLPLGLYYLETLVRLGLSHSKRSYMDPPEKKNSLEGKL